MGVVAGTEVANVVMMGMGGPLVNYDAVVAAMDLMLDHCAYGLSRCRVTVSTAGLAPAMERLRQERPVSLAVSLHAPDNALPSRLVPLNKECPLEISVPICDNVPGVPNEPFFSVRMLTAVNDQPRHARELIKLLKDMR